MYLWLSFILNLLSAQGQFTDVFPLGDLVHSFWSMHPPASVGRLARGRLLFGVQMKSSKNIYVKNPPSTWVVNPAPGLIEGLAAHIKATYPTVDRLVVGDGSLRHGGRYPPHKTHQNGRDIDIRYLLTDGKKGDYSFRFVSAANFDTEKNWAIVKWLYDSGALSRIIMDRRHQRRIWRYARTNLKVPRETLARILAYPYSGRKALVQHARGHFNHFHITLKAPIARQLGAHWSIRQAIRLQGQADRLFGQKYTHVVRRGDTLQQLSKRYGIPLDDIIRWNTETVQTGLKVGTSLVLNGRYQ